MKEEKKPIFDQVAKLLASHGIAYMETNFDKPWGGYFVIETGDESSVNNFIEVFYPERKEELTTTSLPLSPKILCVAPEKRLSWQYHFRRAELWKLIDGEAGYVKNETDEQTEVQHMVTGETLVLGQGERHRLVGLGQWGIIAEIWRHSDPANPSNEDDIVRLEDDFGR